MGLPFTVRDVHGRIRRLAFELDDAAITAVRALLDRAPARTAA
jgi:hypothetical protein